jgi:hypothetical protein
MIEALLDEATREVPRVPVSLVTRFLDCEEGILPLPWDVKTRFKDLSPRMSGWTHVHSDGGLAV